MKIQSLRSRVEAFPLVRPYVIAFREIDAVENVVVELELEGGVVGRGAASPEPHVTGETARACREALEPEALEWLVGDDARRLSALDRELEIRMAATPAARAAVDIALHDALAQALGAPLVDVLGRAHDALPTSITIGIKPLAETLEEAEEYLGRGFRILKVKLGRSLEEDIERLFKLAEKLPRDAAVRVDPNQGYSARDLHTFLERTEALELELVEQPLPVQDTEALRSLPEHERARVALDESLLSPRDALDLVRPPRACGIFNIKLMKCGGIRPARRIAAIAEAADVELMWGCMDESRITISAALHAALASPATRYLDLDGHLDLARDVVGGGFLLEDGVLRTTDAPGLGLDPLADR